MEGLDDRAKALPGYALIERLKSEPLTEELVDAVYQEMLDAHEWGEKVSADKRLRANEGMGWAALRHVWAHDAYKLMAQVQEALDGRLLTDAELVDETVRKPKNNPTGIKAPTMATHGRKK